MPGKVISFEEASYLEKDKRSNLITKYKRIHISYFAGMKPPKFTTELRMETFTSLIYSGELKARPSAI